MRRNIISCAAVALALSASLCFAQSQPPSAPAPHPSAAAQAAPTGPHFPPSQAGNFNAAQPTKAEVDAFLRTSWGYDPNRTWDIYAIQKTTAPGVSKVVVLLGEKPSPKIASLIFFVTPDGKHLITENSVLDFGARPFENNFRILQQRANGPWKGSASKELELVEFADFQCPHCKEAQPVVEKLLHDFPQAHYVFQFFPLVNIHPESFRSAAYGECVKQQGGNAAFFKYADAIFATQDDLDGPTAGAVAALNKAATAAGVDAAKVAACAASPETAKEIHASMQLGLDLSVDETPTLFIDGRAVPMMALPYEQLKKVIEWQFSLDKAHSAASSK